MNSGNELLSRITLLKDLAIKNTQDYFMSKHEIKVEVSALNSHLDLEKNNVENRLKTNCTYFEIGENEKLRDVLLKYLNTAIEQLSDYELDKDGITTNSINSDKNGLVKDYCLSQFYKLFHLSEIKKLNGSPNYDNIDPKQETDNADEIKNIIDENLDKIKEYFNTGDYILLKNELERYFKTGAFTNSNKIIKIVNRPDKKLIGWTLKQIYNNCFHDNRKLAIEYLRFGKQRISIFNDVSFDESNYLKSNLYKYYHTKK